MTQRDHDERWDELALGHVLGGLPDADASSFRGHLAGCGQCRARVAELRSMASDLAAAEREERATQRLRTRTESRDDAVVPPVSDGGGMRRRALVAGAVVAVVVLLLALWAAWLRDLNGELREVAEAHARTLTVLGSGTSVPATTSQSVTGVVAVAGDLVAWSLAGLPTPASDERLVVWVRRDGEVDDVAVYTPDQIAVEDGRLASTAEAADATQLLVTLESVMVPGQPLGDPIVEADLNVVGAERQPEPGTEG